MTSFQTDVVDSENDKSLDAMILECVKDKYKISYAALRWAKEIKQKENLPDPIPRLLPRALREILTGKVDLKMVEELPVVVKMSPSAPGAQPVPAPTLTMKPEEPVEPAEKPELKAAAVTPAPSQEEPETVSVEEEAEKEAEAADGEEEE